MFTTSSELFLLLEFAKPEKIICREGGRITGRLFENFNSLEKIQLDIFNNI